MLERASAGGVIMTRTLARGGPYYVFNYEQNSDSTSGVTSGRGELLETVFLHRSAGGSAGEPGGQWPPVVRQLLPSIRELEQLVGHDSLDVEFALHPGKRPSVLQVRPMAADYGSWRTSDQQVLEALRDAAAYIDGARRPPPFQVGRHGAWGLMPDWNPAEIIG